MHPAVLHQLEFVIRVCKRNNVETSICGQAGSKKEMVKFLVEKGIDSISVNADMAKEISDYIAEIEKATGQEPRQYQPSDSAEVNTEKNKQDWESSEIERVKEEIVKLENEEESPAINGVDNLEKDEEKLDIF
jgi:phosphoenolpyruvate-protein kinase (PTS system EI component)